ncbi:MAG: P1 family peptidase [Bryobacterales bacterium]|nr:P1 family peptidase [Bryobacterales bacterium]
MTRRTAAAMLAGMALRAQPRRPRLREFGIATGTLPPGPLNAITDVAGVRVGHSTVVSGANVRTGVTVVLPHEGNLFREKTPGAVFTGNAFGKLMGSTQVNELGEIESPIALTSTLNVARVADAVLDYMLALPGNETVRSLNVLVGETNDGGLNDIRSRPVHREHVFAALRAARGGAVEEGCVGAGTGTVAFGYKGGIGTASRRTPAGHTVGVLAQTNFGGDLMIAGVPVGRALRAAAPPAGADGSVILVAATDAPLEHRNLHRLGLRAIMGLARTGAAGSNGSGDYAIAFSTARGHTPVANDAMSPLFLAAIEAAEEAILNSLFRATTTTGNGLTVEALPLDRVRTILREYRALP